MILILENYSFKLHLSFANFRYLFALANFKMAVDHLLMFNSLRLNGSHLTIKNLA